MTMQLEPTLVAMVADYLEAVRADTSSTRESQRLYEAGRRAQQARDAAALLEVAEARTALELQLQAAFVERSTRARAIVRTLDALVAGTGATPVERASLLWDLHREMLMYVQEGK